MSDISELWIILCALIVLDLQCGFLCLEAGTVRAKNAGNVALKNITDICCVATVYWLFGFGIMFGASAGGVFGTTGFFPPLDNSSGETAALFFFQLAFAATAATIVSGAVAERERFILAVVRLAKTLGVRFAYPTSTLHLHKGSPSHCNPPA